MVWRAPSCRFCCSFGDVHRSILECSESVRFPQRRRSPSLGSRCHVGTMWGLQNWEPGVTRAEINCCRILWTMCICDLLQVFYISTGSSDRRSSVDRPFTVPTCSGYKGCEARILGRTFPSLPKLSEAIWRAPARSQWYSC